VVIFPLEGSNRGAFRYHQFVEIADTAHITVGLGEVDQLYPLSPQQGTRGLRRNGEDAASDEATGPTPRYRRKSDDAGNAMPIRRPV
jgi:hypothetical protein